MKCKLIIAFLILNCLLNFSLCLTPEEEAAAKKQHADNQAIAAPGDDSEFVSGDFYDDGSYSALVMMKVTILFLNKEKKWQDY